MALHRRGPRLELPRCTYLESGSVSRSSARARRFSRRRFRSSAALACASTRASSAALAAAPAPRPGRPSSAAPPRQRSVAADLGLRRQAVVGPGRSARRSASLRSSRPRAHRPGRPVRAWARISSRVAPAYGGRPVRISQRIARGRRRRPASSIRSTSPRACSGPCTRACPARCPPATRCRCPPSRFAPS